LTAARADWNLGSSDRIYFRSQWDLSHTTSPSAITPIFDKKNKQTWWQGQVIETHTFGPSAASQFLFAHAQIDSASGVDERAKAMAELPTHIFFNPPEQLADLGDNFHTSNALMQYQISGDF